MWNLKVYNKLLYIPYEESFFHMKMLSLPVKGCKIKANGQSLL
jgi:hypothetical protein